MKVENLGKPTETTNSRTPALNKRRKRESQALKI